jgi:polysaccharide biosynthesis protein PslH
MRLLLVTPEIAWPPATGAQVRRWNTLQALRQCGVMDVVVFQSTSRPVLYALHRDCRRVFHLDHRWLGPTVAQRQAFQSTFGRLLLVAGQVRPVRFLGPCNRQLAAWFATLVKDGDYDLLWIVGTATALALGWSDPRRTILDGDNIEHLLNFRLLRTCPWYGAKILDYLDVVKLAWWERQLPRWFARVARCSEDDRFKMPGRKVTVIPNGATVAPSQERTPARRALFVGSLSYEPNRAGLQWFLKEIWRRVRQRAAGAELDIVGGSPSPWLLAQDGREGVRVHGFVEDLGPFWNGAALSIAPLLAGSGTRLKILESLGRGVPVVTTTVGAEGIALGEEHGVLREDDAGLFAGRCVELLENLPETMALGERGKQAVAAQYSWEKIQLTIQELVGTVAAETAKASA